MYKIPVTWILMQQDTLQQIYLQEVEAEEILQLLQSEFPNESIGFLDQNGFYSALNKPKNIALYAGEKCIAEHAARLMMAFAEGQYLTDANKRMGVRAAEHILKSNGYILPRFYEIFLPMLACEIKDKRYTLDFILLSIDLAMRERGY